MSALEARKKLKATGSMHKRPFSLQVSQANKTAEAREIIEMSHFLLLHTQCYTGISINVVG